MSALDATSKRKVAGAVVFDGGAYFHMEEDALVRGGPAWVFPGPFMYQFSAEAIAAPPSPHRPARGPQRPAGPRPLQLLFRMVSRFERSEVRLSSGSAGLRLGQLMSELAF